MRVALTAQRLISARPAGERGDSRRHRGVAGRRRPPGYWALFCVSSTFVALSQPAIGQAFPQRWPAVRCRPTTSSSSRACFCVQWGIGLLIDAHARERTRYPVVVSWCVCVVRGKLPAVVPVVSVAGRQRPSNRGGARPRLSADNRDDRYAAMPGLLIIAHAPLASSLKAVAQHAFPDCARLLEALDVDADDDAGGDRGAGARAARLACRNREALILTDVFGATPCNVAQRLADGTQVKVITGVNVPMLWRSLCYADEPLDAHRDARLGGRHAGRDAGGHVTPAEPGRHKPGANDPAAASPSAISSACTRGRRPSSPSWQVRSAAKFS